MTANERDPRRTWCVVGAGGFVGRHLMRRLAGEGSPVRALGRSGAPAGDASAVRWHQGDLLDGRSLASFVEPGSDVVNLAYLGGAGEAANLAAIGNLLAACRERGVRRLVHCSTADVAGRADGHRVDETTPCRPVTEYERTKHAVEAMVRESAAAGVDTVVLRPTAVFGEGGANAVHLASQLLWGPRFANRLRACVHGRRRMHLVPVQTVVAAIEFLAGRQEPFAGEVFLVGEDEDEANNYLDVAACLARAMGLPPASALPPLPDGALSLLLRLRGRGDVDPRRVYSSARLRALGFRPPVALEAALAEFGRRYAASHGHGGAP